jgi:hypothetical protein
MLASNEGDDRDFRKQQREHPPIHINRTAVEKVESSLAYISLTN